ncbi:MAG: PilZ domain-containing protein, partial [Bdellovibrionota bacterium]
MSASLRKFVPRSPRYTLRPTDNSFMRFAQKGELGRSHITHFVDISMSGLAFITDRETAPFLFEMIKIEIPLDGGEQVAWWAKVVRVEAYEPQKWYLKKADMDETKVMVAVQYHDLPMGHLQKIKKTLDHKFVELEREKVAERFK